MNLNRKTLIAKRAGFAQAMKPFLVVFLFILLAVNFSGCSLPGFGEEPTPAPESSDTLSLPTVSVGPLPPALVETKPLPGSELSLNGDITFYFNQPMERASVEAALVGTPALNGTFSWQDDATLIFSPAQPWEPDSSVSITLATSAQSVDGLTAALPQTVDFRTADYLRINQMLPMHDTREVAPESAIVVSFSEPVVPLGVVEDLPAAFTLEPAAAGRGEWLNTSTYVFYPDPALFGGTMYTVRVAPDLTSTAGTGLDSSGVWSFFTLEPGYAAYSPQKDALHVRLDEPVTVTFNQAMDTASVEQAFTLTDAGQRPVAGAFSWSEDLKEMTFTPDELYQRGTRYTFTIPGGVLSLGGAVLPDTLSRSFFSAMEFFVLSTNPASGQDKGQYSPVEITFNAPFEVEDPLDYISVEPEVKLRAEYHDNELFLYGYFEAEQSYTVTVSGELTDIWGSQLNFDYPFTFRGAPLQASFFPSIFQGNGLVFVNPDDPLLTAQVVNVDSVYVAKAMISIDDYLNLQHSASYDERINFQPANFTQTEAPFDIDRNRNQIVPIPLNGGEALEPSLYWVMLDPQPTPQYSQPFAIYCVISHVQMVYKAGATDALVWAIDLRTNSPVSGQQVVIYDTAGSVLATGVTNETGMFTTDLFPNTTDNTLSYAVLANPGEEFFSVARSDWNHEISIWDFGIRANFSKPQTEYYLYTDRPIYRPGQDVAFKVVAREELNGRYQLPTDSNANISVRDNNGVEIDTITIPYSEFGTAQGSFSLPEYAEPGYYDLVAQDEDFDRSVTFQVAEYRKPEIDLSLSFGKEEFLAGEQLDAQVSSRYFFDAPASDVSLNWNLYAKDTSFSLPGYQVGPADMFFYSPFFGSQLGNWLIGGEGITGDDGGFSVTAVSKVEEQLKTYTLEVTMQDESGFPVTNRTTTLVHPASFYIGIKPDTWIGQIDTDMNFDLLVVDWDRNPVGNQNLSASFGEVRWVPGGQDEFGLPAYEKQINVLAEGVVPVNQNGKARLPFTPALPGVYQLEVRSGNAVSQLLFWVGGPGEGRWPAFDNNRITLLPSGDSFMPGEIASVFIPNPFPQTALALITTERGEVMSSQIIQISDSGINFPIQLTDADVPNVYFTVTVLGVEENGSPGFRYGVVNLPVDAGLFQLNVEVIGQPERSGPGEPVNFTIKVTDANGAPVQAEFSLSVVDQAVLALAGPFEENIFNAFYDIQPLGVQTGVSLAADAVLFYEPPPGLGGGGAGDFAPQSIRSDFKDTAYWNGVVVTGPDGTAEVEAVLPDNLTTWQVLARGLTRNTLVGEAVSEVVVTKPLIVRPVTPRFAITGDHIQLAAVLQNTTDQSFSASITMKATGFALDDPTASMRTVDLPAQSRVRVVWWGTVEEVESVDLIFSAEGGGYSDITQPAAGSIPVAGYLAPQTFSTAGVLDEGGEQQELVSLPRSFDPDGGSLRLELSPSLAGVALEGLDLIEDVEYQTTEQTVSQFLPNLEIFLALQEFGLETDELENRLIGNLVPSINKLSATQNFDGGWSWYGRFGYESNPYLSAYVLLGLVRAEQAGFAVHSYVLDAAVPYLIDSLQAIQSGEMSPWEYDQAAFIHFVLVEANAPVIDLAYSLLDKQASLSPWGRALLGLVVMQMGEDQRSSTVFSDLQTSAVRSATGVHWETDGFFWQNMASSSLSHEVVLYALAKLDPASPLVADAVRYLMASRDEDGGWHSSFATAWALMAITEVMRGTGELGGEFAFSARLNDNPFASGQAGGVEQFNQVVAETGLNSLLPDLPNQLTVQRDPGSGRLYYRAALEVIQPVEEVSGLNRGIGVSRVYYPQDANCRENDCQPVHSAQVGELITVRVTLNLAHDLNHLAVQDYIPAGTEILNLDLKTSQLGQAEQTQNYTPEDPFKSGWGWWFFNQPQVYDDHISWVAEYLPAGTYELTYTLVLLQPGSYRVIPAQAYQLYFPEVQGVSAGAVFEVVP